MSYRCPYFAPTGEPCGRGASTHYPHVGASVLFGEGSGHVHDWVINGDWDGGPSSAIPVRQCVQCNAVQAVKREEQTNA